MKNRNYIIFLLLTAVLATVGVWIVKILKGDVPLIDQWTRELVAEMEGTYIHAIFRWITNLGSEPFMVPFTVITAFILWWMYRDWLPAIIFSFGTLSSHLLNKLIKLLVERERPSILVSANAEGHSFPSGHAMISMVCYGLLAYFLVKKITSKKLKLLVQVFLALLIFLIGISRYVINVHYLTDVAAGFLFGYLCMAGLIYLYEWLQKRRNQT